MATPFRHTNTTGAGRLASCTGSLRDATARPIAKTTAKPSPRDLRSFMHTPALRVSGGERPSLSRRYTPLGRAGGLAEQLRGVREQRLDRFGDGLPERVVALAAAVEAEVEAADDRELVRARARGTSRGPAVARPTPPAYIATSSSAPGKAESPGPGPRPRPAQAAGSLNVAIQPTSFSVAPTPTSSQSITASSRPSNE